MKMVIVNQDKTKTTESLEFDIREVKTCRNIVIKEEQWKKFKKITKKEDDCMNFKELKGLNEFLEQDIIKSVYLIVEVKENRNFGIYSTREKAKKILQAMIQKIGEQKSYTLPKDKFAEILL